MSRIGRKPVKIPAGVTVSVNGSRIVVKGPKGELQREFDQRMRFTLHDGELRVDRPSDEKFFKALHGLYRKMVDNMIVGVTRGFEKKLEIVGIGYKAEIRNKRLVLQLGYSHPIVFVPPADITIACENPTSITVSGIDRELVGQVAAKIRAFKLPEPYKGKGIKYVDEVIRRKAGKTAGS
ncbi:MAG: 50S ribosomal protein L6 [candidate division KSB1 bacterium]|nr:50S ribosomal protein L6 [candidate division KSB1 bacterium]